MKKSQVLAALALAFALGVVAPVSSANAYILAEEGKDEVVEGIEKAMAQVEALGNCTEGSKDLFTNYRDLINAVNNGAIDIEAAMNGGKDSTGATVTGAYATLKAFMSNTTPTTGFVALMQAAGVAANNNAWKNYNGTEVNAYSDYTSLVAYANGLADALQIAYEADNTLTAVGTAAEALRDTATPGNGAVEQAEATVKSAKDTARDAIKAILGAAPFSQVTSGITTYDQAVAAAKGMPKYSNFEVIMNQYYITKNIKDGAQGFYVKTAREALDALNYDVANFCSTTLGTTVVNPTPDTNEPEAPAANAPKPGNTGVVAGADATAKATVSIMAAIASVATAAFVAIRKIAAGKKA